MSLVQSIKDGKVIESASATSVSTAAGSRYDKDTFLQLLVAEVSNQDPLEPTSNTEWISQYATFSELEEMQNMSASYDLSRASTLVGKLVQMAVKDSKGVSSLIEGRVDYVTYENGNAYLSINGSLYSLDDLYTVVDEEYDAAYQKAYDWTVSMNKLPSYANVTLAADQKKIEDLYDQYNKMSDYEKSFIASDSVEVIKKYYARIQELLKSKEQAEKTGDEKKEVSEETLDALTSDKDDE